MSRTCPQHAAGDPMCHYPSAMAPIIQQATPAADEGVAWQVIGDMLVAAVVTAAALWFVFSVWLAR